MRIDTERIKDKTDLRQIAAQHTTLTGNNSKAGPCPKCGGDNRFVVYESKFLCRQCHPAYGDAIEFAAWLNDFDAGTRTGLHAAANWLTNGNTPTLSRVGLPKPTTPTPRPVLKPPAEIWQQRAAAFVAYAQEQLWQPAGRAGLDYLLSRGLSEVTIKAAGLGYNPQDITTPAHKWGITGRDSVWLPGPGVVIPWAIDTGLHRINIRLLEPRQIRRTNGKTETIKYIGPAGWGDSNPLYNANSITPHKPVLLVEGELCALTAQQEAGDLITAAATGAKDAARAGRWIARLATAPFVLLAFDAEPGKGDEAARQWAELLPHNSRRWRPLLKDINDMHRAGVSVRNWIAAAQISPHPTTEPFKVVIWPTDTPVVALPRFTRLGDGRLRTEYQSEAEFLENVYTVALLKEAVSLGGIVRVL